jgi:hypothetical protein
LAASGFVSGFVTGLGFGFAGVAAGGEAAGADCWARAGASQAATDAPTHAAAHAAAPSSKSVTHRRIPNRRIRRRCIRTSRGKAPKSYQRALIPNISTFIQFERTKSCAHSSVQIVPARFPNPQFSWLEKRGPMPITAKDDWQTGYEE